MDIPQMIIFDYGYTLLYESDFDLLRGQRAVFEHVVRNPGHVTAEQALAFGEALFQEADACRRLGYELHELQILRMEYEYFGLELDISYAEAERILLDNTSPGAQMPHIEELLTYLQDNGIRSGVISNIGWSGEALTERINRLLPNNDFAFIIASSEYGIRKPDRRIFDLALRKAGLSPDEVWYCGDTIKADIFGAHSAGIFPVYYEELTVERPWTQAGGGPHPDFDYLHVHDWREVISTLKELTGRN